MVEVIVSILVGITLVITGILNTKGIIWAIHSYHRANISEEDKLPFGKMVGLGNIVMGVVLFISGILSGITLATENDIYSIIGRIILIVGIVVGIVISFVAIKKYNKRIF